MNPWLCVVVRILLFAVADLGGGEEWEDKNPKLILS